MKRRILPTILVDIYFWASVLSVFAFGVDFDAKVLLSVGAASGWLCFAFGMLEDLNRYVGIFSVLWVLFLPILLIVSYFLAHKKIYIPFCVITTIDTVIVLLWLFHVLMTGGTGALDFVLLDAVVSVIYSAALIGCLIIGRKEMAELKRELMCE